MQANWWDTYRRIPYLSGGRSHKGVDCYGLIYLVYAEQLGINLPAYTDVYTDAEKTEQTDTIIRAHMGEDWNTVQTPEAFDVILLRIGHRVCHIGLIYRSGWMIHCLAGSQVTCERYNGITWKNRIVGFCRYIDPSINLPVSSKDILVSARPHPLSMERISYIAPAGMSLAEIITQIEGTPLGSGHAYVGTRYVPHKRWYDTFPSVGERVTFAASLPAGGGGDNKDVLRIVAIVAVTAVAAWAGPVAAEALGLAGGTALLAGAAVTTGISVAGSLAIHALIPPVTPERLSDGSDPSDERSQPSYMISSNRNRLRPWSCIPLVLGTVYNYAPPLAAKPWTEIVGNDVYYHMLVLWGYGPLEIDDLRLGDTPVSDYRDVEVHTYANYTPGDKITGWAKTVHEESLNVKLLESDGYTTRTISDADEATVVFTFPQLVRIADDGEKKSRSVDLKMQWRPVGGSWHTYGADKMETPARSWNVSSFSVYIYLYCTLIFSLTGRLYWRTEGTGGSYPGVPSGDFGIANVKIYRERIYDPPTETYSYETSVVEVVDIRGSKVNGMEVTTSDSDTVIEMDSGYVEVDKFRVTAAQTTVVRRSVSVVFPENGDYEIRCKRVTADSDDSQIADEVYWNGLQSIIYEAPIQGPEGVTLAVTTLRIRASEQLAGNIDELNGTVSSILDNVYDLDEEAWVPDTKSAQPGDLVRHILQSDVTAKSQSDSKLDLPAFEEFVEFTTDKNLTYNNVIERQMEVKSLIQEICSAGRAMPRLVDGTWSVVVDKERSEYAQTFTAENIWNLSVSKALDIPTPHGWRVIFRNSDENGAVDERIVYDDGYSASNATDIQILELPGVTEPDAVWQHARYHIAVVRLRPRKIEFYADMEHLVAQRGDLIELNHPTPLWGSGSGRVKSIETSSEGDVESITLTDEVQMEAGESYVARFRLADGTRLTKDVQTDPGDTDTIILETPIPDGDPAPEPGDICAFGPAEKVATDLIIRNIFPIESKDRMSARIECVDYSPDIFDADTGDIPAYDPNITKPIWPDRLVPATPVITNILANEYAMIRMPSEELQPRIILEFLAGSGGDIESTGFDVQYRLSSESDWTSLASLPDDARRAVIADVDDGRTYDVRLRAKSTYGTKSQWTEQNDITVEIDAPPAPSEPHTIYISGRRYLAWSPSSIIAPPRYEIRRGAAWESAQVLGRTLDTRYMIPGPGLYWIAARYGNKYSDSQISLSVDDWGVQANVVAEVDSSGDGWPGDKDAGLSVVGDDLVLDGDTALSATYTIPSEDRITMTSAALCQIGYELGLYGQGPDDNVYSWDDIYAIENVYGSYGQYIDGTVEIRTQDESDDWGDWEIMDSNEYYGKGFDFRLTLETEDPDVECGAYEWTIEVDVPDRSERERGVSIGTDGESITFSKEFNDVPTIHVQIVNAQAGDRDILTNESTTGFTVSIVDAAGDPISRTINWRAQGY